MQISATDIYRYRKQRGVNLGSWFVLERWISDTPFRNAKAPAQSDLDVAHGSNAQEILEQHWDTWIQESDWDWIARHGINSVRIPIGYYHLCGADPSVLHATDFQPFHDVYSGAWSRIVRAIQSAAARNVGVLIDLHAAPGKQNNDSHAGTSDRANFFGDVHNQNCTLRVLKSLIQTLTLLLQESNPPLNNIIGIELLNEPHPPSDHALQKWYTEAISTIRELDSSIPIYIGDCWRLDTYADFISHHASSGPLVLDHHLYRCFTSSDIHTSVQDLSRSLADHSASFPQALKRAAEKIGRAGGGVVIGEWSGALNPGSLRGVPGEQREYVDVQLGLYEKVCAGWFFWTYKKEHGSDTGWSFRDAVDGGAFPELAGPQRKNVDNSEGGVARRNRALEESKRQAFGAHIDYWSRISGSYNHPLFESGFEAGWNDAYTFMLSTPSSSPCVTQLGFIGAWARRRSSDHSKHYWEFEHGFMQGVDAANAHYQAAEN
ncbi:glycoside hydrolase [Agrocybe pediades]|nr:glycoside hydrolase [Agrocybe pediades]